MLWTELNKKHPCKLQLFSGVCISFTNVQCGDCCKVNALFYTLDFQKIMSKEKNVPRKDDMMLLNTWESDKKMMFLFLWVKLQMELQTLFTLAIYELL